MRLQYSFLAALMLSVSAGASSAQTADVVEDRLNDSDLCSALPDFGISEVANLLGIPVDVPSWVPDSMVTAQWDKNRHTVNEFNTEGGQVTLQFDAGCQPSSESAGIKYTEVSARDVRLRADVLCTADVDGNNVQNTSCEVTNDNFGEGDALASYVDLNTRISNILSNSVAR